MFNRFTFWFAVLSFAAMYAIAATASPTRNTSVAVSLRDVDLATPVGARTVLARIEQAADHACGGDPLKQPYRFEAVILAREFGKCFDATVAPAVAATRASLVQRFYADQRPRFRQIHGLH